MELPRDAVLLRVFFGEDDKFERLPLYEAITLLAGEGFPVRFGWVNTVNA